MRKPREPSKRSLLDRLAVFPRRDALQRRLVGVTLLKPYLQDPDATLYHGDVREVLAELPDASVDCVATSPPFYGLRDYGTGTWEGGDEECDHAQRQRASEAARSGGGRHAGSDHAQEGWRGGICGRCGARCVDKQIGLEATPDEWANELVKVFRECRRVLKDTGTLWVEVGDSYAGSWGNQGRKAERGTQRPINGGILTPVLDGRYPDKGSNTGAIPDGTDLKPKDLIGTPWLLAFALRADGWYLRQAIIWHKPNCMPESVTDRCTTAHSYVFLFSKKPRYWFDAEAIAEPSTYAGKIVTLGEKSLSKGQANGAGVAKSGNALVDSVTVTDTKNPRSVWMIPTQGYPEAHFATWPEALCERIIKAGCPEGGTILDPFGGSGTTAFVARRLGRRSVSVELNESYCELFARRLQQLSLLAEDAA